MPATRRPVVDDDPIVSGINYDIGSHPQNARAIYVADLYKQHHGLAPHPPVDYSRVVALPDSTRALAKGYDLLSNRPQEEAFPAFHAMGEETGRQFDYLTRSPKRGGLGLSVFTSRENPYSGPQEMFNDIADNKRIRVLSDSATGGHPVFSPDQNEQFRAVHDVFGHYATGRGFDRHGEEAAYLHHARMYSPLARRALAVETRGQNSSLITNGTFPRQKVGLMGAQASGVMPLVGRRSHFLASARQARKFNFDQFGPQE